ncbi:MULTISPECIES: AMP-binding protein [unclassified Streptomyces]|uniref:non-ribosomal peptide synthetase n=1 Tax=unclassified Streptomyces TaxID=2593676 RepID=UPI000CD542AA|nr:MULTISPECIES: amino acid adenylation domain-containing protein [unclassified Streptomyces]
MSDPTHRHVPASDEQRGLWLLRELGSGAAPRRRAYRVAGDLDVAALAAAWRSLVDRHELLRSTLVLRDGLPVRRVRARSGEQAVRLGGPDGGPSAPQGAEPVGGAPGAVLTVTACGPGEHRVRITVPAEFADEDFMDLLVEELTEVCARGPLPAVAEQGATPPAAVDLPEVDSGEALAWWLSTLDPLPGELPLPADHLRPDRASGRWGQVSAPADAGLGRAVTRCAEAGHSSASVVMLTAFQVLLHRYTGSDRVAVAVPVRRDGAGAANILVLPADIEAERSFAEILDRGTALAAEAMARRNVPLARVAGALPVVRDPRRVPLGNVVFDHRWRPKALLAIPGTVVEPCLDDSGPAPADLVLRVDDSGSGPVLTVVYDADQFEPETARMILRQFRTLLGHAVRAPGTRVDELALDSPARMARAAAETDRWADDRAPGYGVVEAFGRHAARDPQAVAVDGPDGTLTYAGLHAAAARVAEDLRAAGARAGDPVVVRLPVGVGQYAALLGAWWVGAHVCWLGTADNGDRSRAVLRELRPVAMLVASGADGTEGAPADPGEPLVQCCESIGCELVPVGAPAPLSPPAPSPTPPGAADRAYVAFTSGSTGVPKGIAHTHATLAQFTVWMADEFGIGPGVRVAQWVAAEHDPALAETFAALGSGATLCPVPTRIRANPERMVHWLVTERIGVLQTVPSFARELLRVIAERRSVEGMGSLRTLLLMGEALPGDLTDGMLAALPRVRIVNIYGPTETVAATWHPVGRRPQHGTGTVAVPPTAAAPVPIGRPIPGRGVTVVDEADRPCPAGVTGELVVTGPYVADGYLAERDHAAFAPLPGLGAPCYRTGDLARRRPDGALEFRGRKDSQIKLYGNRLELTDVEAALSGHLTVADCAVAVTAEGDGLARRLVICVVPHTSPDGEPQGSPREWRAHLRRRFGRSLLPALYRTLDRLPRTVTGKIDRPRLARTLAAAERDAAARPPAPGTESDLVMIWADLLGAPPAHADQSFFGAGGTSLLVPRLLHEVRRRFAADVSVAQFYAHQSLAALAALIDRNR